MKMIVNNKEITINDKLMKIANSNAKMVTTSIRVKADQTNNLSYYFAFILAMHTITADILSIIDEDDLQALMTFNETHDLVQKDTLKPEDVRNTTLNKSDSDSLLNML